ncbi:MAG: MOSC domain-containing protein [Eubacteriales bacterium]
MGKVLSVNLSSIRGVVKNSVEEAMIIEGWGVQGDAHGGDWDRQVSIFPIEALEKVPEEKRKEVFTSGYSENFTIEGIALDDFMAGSVVKLGEAEIEIKQVGKEYKEFGRPYIVSREGRFGRVLKGGKVRVGDEASVINK